VKKVQNRDRMDTEVGVIERSKFVECAHMLKICE
jgi:hypothetical protein